MPQPVIGARLRHDGEDVDTVLFDIIENTVIADSQSILWLGNILQPFNATFTDLLRLVAQMSFNPVPDHSSIMRIQVVIVVSSVGREDDLVSHYVQMITNDWTECNFNLT